MQRERAFRKFTLMGNLNKKSRRRNSRSERSEMLKSNIVETKEPGIHKSRTNILRCGGNSSTSCVYRNNFSAVSQCKEKLSVARNNKVTKTVSRRIRKGANFHSAEGRQMALFVVICTPSRVYVRPAMSRP